MQREYTKAPLPFQGQKRNFLKKFKEVLKHYHEDSIYIDLFGGSGLLSHTIKQFYPKSKVIYNDFDNYKERLENITKTNHLLSDIRKIVETLDKDEKLSVKYKNLILDRIAKESGFIDFITLSSSLLFSGKYETTLEGLRKQTFYNKVQKTIYAADGYLEGVDRVSVDYKVLIKKYQNSKNVVFIFDPPYLSTDVKSYKDVSFWKLSEYLDILSFTKDFPFIYFTSEKSQLVELCEWLKNNNYLDPISGATITSVTNHVNHNSSYRDIMIHRNQII
ncbi:DNA adenine methylase [Chryseobacterium sp. ZHDP1]|uniref:DNA adenine methylase n=1 Tax=Chryseobacterium sp. ZHDP1 TaxID=2838877 RepID=UPI001BE0691E|nr:DNA adenine methylase [Chryseobacterium sp. ZHDP1]QWA38873.1 DNA adenine methylase [Chryseobacterium sp. ZHDP1]